MCNAIRRSQTTLPNINILFFLDLPIFFSNCWDLWRGVSILFEKYHFSHWLRQARERREHSGNFLNPIPNVKFAFTGKYSFFGIIFENTQFLSLRCDTFEYVRFWRCLSSKRNETCSNLSLGLSLMALSKRLGPKRCFSLFKKRFVFFKNEMFWWGSQKLQRTK